MSYQSIRQRPKASQTGPIVAVSILLVAGGVGLAYILYSRSKSAAPSASTSTVDGSDVTNDTVASPATSSATASGTASATTSTGTGSPAPYVYPNVTGLVGTSTSGSTVALTWSAPTTGNAVLQYRVYYSTVAANKYTPWAFATSTSSTVTGLAQATDYQFEVVCITQQGESPVGIQTNATTLSPPAPLTGLSQAGLTSTSVTLSWNQSSGATGYIINVQQSANASFALFNTITSGSTLSAQCTLQAGQSYNFQVLPTGPGGSGTGMQTSFFTAPSATSTTVPTTPGSLNVSSPTCLTALVTWNANSSNTDQYVITYQDKTKNTTAQTVTITGLNSSSTTLTGLNSNDTYSISIVASSNTAGSSPARSTTFVQPPTPAPSAPSNVSFTGNLSTNSLTWSAGTGDSTYNYYYVTGSTTSSTVTGVKVTNVTNVTLPTYGTYTFYVAGCGDGINYTTTASSYVASAAVTITLPAPATPQNFTTTNNVPNAGGYTCTLVWNASPYAASYLVTYTLYGSTHTAYSGSGLSCSASSAGGPEVYTLTASNATGTSAGTTLTLNPPGY